MMPKPNEVWGRETDPESWAVVTDVSSFFVTELPFSRRVSNLVEPAVWREEAKENGYVNITAMLKQAARTREMLAKVRAQVAIWETIIVEKQLGTDQWRMLNAIKIDLEQDDEKL